MRVLVVVHGFPLLASGGCEIYAHAHARALQALGDEVFVLTREHDPSAAEYLVRRDIVDGLPVIRINNLFRKTRDFDDSYRNPDIAAIATRFIDEIRPDVAHIHHLTALSTAIVDSLDERQIPSVFTLHDYWLMCHRGQLFDRRKQVCAGPGLAACHTCLGPEAGVPATLRAGASAIRAIGQVLPAGPAGYLRNLAGAAAAAATGRADVNLAARRRADHMRAMASKVTQFLAPSRFLEQRFLEFGVPPERMTHVNLGVDHAPFAQLRRTAEPRLRLGFLGSVMSSKAPHLLLEAFQRLPRGVASVDVIGGYTPYHGDDSYRARITPLLALDGVRSHGAMPHAEAIRQLASIDVLVVPSMWPENSPLVVREAFLAGVPVVAADIGGLPELVTHEVNGLIFRAGDVEDLARTLTRLLAEPALLPLLRAGLPAVRTIEDDARWSRELYNDVRARRAPVVGPDRAIDTAPAAARLAAVIVDYRTPDDTFLAVRSLLASRHPVDDVIVVSQGTDELDGAKSEPWTTSGDVSADDRLRVTSLTTDRNLGFSGGVNAGIGHALAAGADFVLLVNSDAVVPPDAIGWLVRRLQTESRTGIAGPSIRSRRNPRQIASMGLRYSAATGRVKHRDFGEDAAKPRPGHEPAIEAVSGCVMLIRREVFERIGLFDEDYFFSFEDLDFCLRARRAGFLVEMVRDAVVYHEGGRSIGANSPPALYFAARNHLLFAGRADPRAGSLRVAGRTASIVALNVAHAIRSGRGSAFARLSAVGRGSLDYFRNRLGRD